MFPTTSVSRAATWMLATILFIPPAALAGPRPKDWNPGIDPADFVERVDNPYFPLPPGRTMVYRAWTRAGTEQLTIEVRFGARTILGVYTTVVVETATLNGQTVEISENWFAQDRQGNVWYLGESSQEYENGIVVSTEGSWEAGQNGARPGIIMKAEPRPGDTYYQEFAPGVAEDMASVISTTKTATVLGQTYTSVLLTREWTALEPNSVERKYYAPGLGLVLEEKGPTRMELVEVR